MCSQLHVPADADLVVVELGESRRGKSRRPVTNPALGINDPPAMTTIVNFELLLRQLLEAEHESGVLVFK